MNENEAIGEKGRFAFVCIFLSLFISNFMMIGLGMLIPSICADLNISLQTAGIFGSITFFSQVAIAFPVAALATRVRPKYTMGLMFFCLTAGCLLHAFAQNTAMIIIGRVLFAVFANSLGAPIQMVKSTWVPLKKINSLNAIQEVSSTLGQVIGTAGITALICILSSWRKVVLALGILSAVVTVIWFVFYQDNKERPVVLAAGAPFFASVKDALKHREFWLLAIGWPGTTLVWIAFTTFWPSYAVQYASLAYADVGSAIGMIPIGSLVATLVSVPLANVIGYDKLMIWPWGILLPVFYLISLSTSDITILRIVFFLAGFGAFAFVPIAMGIPWKLSNISTRGIATGISFIIMCANIGGGLAGVAVGALMVSLSLKKALTICAFSPLLWLATSLFLPELGRKHQERLAARLER